jgi:uncharacterized protein (TIGR03437 family)
MTKCLLAFGAMLLCRFAAAQTSILPPDPISCFATEGPSSSIRLSIVNVEGQPFSRAMHVSTLRASANPWDLRIRCFNTAPVKQNDTILATFWLRAISGEGGNAFTTFVIEKGKDPYTKSVSWTAQAGPEWKKFTVPFKMLETYNAQGSEGYNVSFWVTFDPQEIEIGGFSLLNYGQNFPFNQLELVNWPYEGHAPGSPWRAEAAARIEKIRKSDIVVVVRDDNGQPVPNAAVHIKMKKHAFGFGTAISAAGITDTTANGQKYRDTLLQNYNKIVVENDLKWPFWEDTRSWPRDKTMAMFDWLDQSGITMKRGHNLIWPGKSNLPSDVATMLSQTPVNTQALRNRINSHIAEEAGAIRGRVTEWDVLNEPVTNKDVQAALGNAEMAVWFQKAREAEPNAKLYVNDYDIVAAGGVDIPHQNAYFNIIREMIANGAPLDGIGVQGHFDSNLTPPARVWSILDRFASFGKDLQVTEFDINIDDEQLQADYLRDFLTTTFAHSAVKGFVMWGFWEGRHWLPKGALWRRDWTIKPSGLAWQDLVYKQWWTDAQGATGADGIYRIRGFLGDYDVEVTANGRTQTIPLSTADAAKPAYVTVGKQPSGTVSNNGVVNAASFVAGPVAPGEMVTIYGSGFGSPAIMLSSYDAGKLPGSVGDTRVYFDGVPAPMIYSFAGQVSAIVPYGVSGSTTVEVEYLGKKSEPAVVPVAASAPGIFTCGGKPSVAVVVNNTDNNLISCADNWRPAAKGAILTLFITGEGQTNPAGIDGAAPVPPTFPAPAGKLTVSFGGVEAQVIFAGLVYAGVTQLNVLVPQSAPSGAVPLAVNVGGAASQPGVTVSLQ